MKNVALFLETVYHLSKSNEDKAIDTVYDFMDDSLLEGDFSSCDAALSAALPENMSLAAVYSFLMVTTRAKPKLPSRAVFITRVLDFLDKDPAMAEDVRAVRKYQ